MLAVVLAGGEGNRLGALTEGRAKPAVPFGGMYRLIDFALSNCANSGLENVWVVEQYLPQALNEHLANGRPWDLDRSRGGLLVLPPYQGGEDEGFAEGNADALFRHLDAMRAFGPDVVLVLSADHVFTLDLRDVVDAHLEARAALTMVTKRLPGEDVSRYGVVRTDGAGRVEEFAYKPEDPPSDVVTTEVFAYDAGRLFATLQELGGNELKDFGHELIPRSSRVGTRVSSAWKGTGATGTIPSYGRATRTCCTGRRSCGSTTRPGLSAHVARNGSGLASASARGSRTPSSRRGATSRETSGARSSGRARWSRRGRSCGMPSSTAGPWCVRERK